MSSFRIGNIMLGTTDLERSLSFYSTLLELPVQFQSTEMACLDAGAITLGLSTPTSRREVSPF
jgi:catechol 2,3-dioxygenase-like lactoylglutathione lyase family enzyme